MKEKDEIATLFTHRLSGAEMPVRDGFWEQLQAELPTVPIHRSYLSHKFYRIVAAASLAMLLGVASAAFWYLSPKEEIQDAFTQIVLTPEAPLKGDMTQETFHSPYQTASQLQHIGHRQSIQVAPTLSILSDEEEMVSVHVSITFQQRVYANRSQASVETTYSPTDIPTVDDNFRTDEQSASQPALSKSQTGKWAVKVGVGTSLPKANCHMPLTANVTAECKLTEKLSLEAGLQYNRLGGEQTIHTLSLPVKLNTLLAEGKNLDFYATAGGKVEKCISGSVDNSFSAEPIQFSLVAGLGVRYKVNDRLALFAEPTVSHHFDTRSHTHSLYAERPTNLNLLCGVRVTY
ncbi:MAG: porin family protein [Bacteroides sp.]|nr:porin family protein [Bacteroides sp.]